MGSLLDDAGCERRESRLSVQPAFLCLILRHNFLDLSIPLTFFSSFERGGFDKRKLPGVARFSMSVATDFQHLQVLSQIQKIFDITDRRRKQRNDSARPAEPGKFWASVGRENEVSG
jgi:hypothetical protein